VLEYYNTGFGNFDSFLLADKIAIMVKLIFGKDLEGKGVQIIS